jgi:hypothetical protein
LGECRRAGCRSDHRGLTSAPVSGTITYHGKPLVGAEVDFLPDSGALVTHAKTDDQGCYRLGTVKAKVASRRSR